jgi:hypothetical protein
MKPFRHFMLGLLLFSGSSISIGAIHMQSKDLPSTKKVNEKFIKQYCEPPLMVTVFKDKEGNVGGYVVSRTDVMDTPVTYFDAYGEHYATFHIFGTDVEKKQAGEKIALLKKRFPLSHSVDCSKY